MIALARGGWILSAAFFATIGASILHVEHVGAVPVLLLGALAVACVLRPAAALGILALVLPVAWFLLSQRWNRTVPWSEVIVCVALAALSVDAARRPRPLPPPVAGPAMLFGLVVAGAMIVSVGVQSLRLGPAFREELAAQLLYRYFVDLRSFPALHAGMLLIESVLLFVLAARAANGRPRVLYGIARATVAGAALAGAFNVAHLFDSASRGGAFWRSLASLSQSVRWNVHYGDFNAAGSYFAMAALIAAAIVARDGLRVGALRGSAWAGALVLCGGALWLTGSRAAYAAAGLALVAVVAATRFSARHRVIAGTALALLAMALVTAIALVAPMRGNQHSTLLAADVRLGMAKTAGRMIASRPVFGIGLGEFYRHSGEFSPPDLVQKFPAAIHENAHNNFLQIAAELGLTGAVLFVWLVGAAFALVAWHAARDAFQLLVLAALSAFVLTWLAGHPLLVPEAAYAFWIALGAAAGGTREAGTWPPAGQARRRLVAAAAVVLACSVPWQLRTGMREADLEHVAIGLSAWEISPDGVRYREAEGPAVLFVPAGAFRFGVTPRTDHPVRMELRLDGRVADVVLLNPGQWNDVALLARSERSTSRYARLDVRVLDDQTPLWITKVEPIR